MKVLIVEDDFTSQMILENILTKFGFEVIKSCNGQEAWEVLQKANPPHLILLDKVMPIMDGLTLCKKIRENKQYDAFYIILLTGQNESEDIIEGLKAGANDYLTKPYDTGELLARIGVGKRTIELQMSLEKKIAELNEAINHVKTLQGLIPICSYCKKIRDDSQYWQQIESYVAEHTNAQFSHSVCPECYDMYVIPMFEEAKAEMTDHKEE